MGSTVWSNSTGRAYLHNPAQICLSTIYANCQLVLVQIHRSLLLTRNCQKLEYDFLGWQNEMNHIQNRIKHPKLVTSKSNSQSLNLHQGGVPNVSFPSVSPTSSSIISGKTSSSRCRVLRKVRLNFTASSARVP